MQTTNNSRAITVGLFIFIGLLIFVVGVFTLGSQKKAFTQSFALDVVFDDIQGLKAGNNVWFSGVKVGTIKKIEFYGTSQVLVTLNIELEAQKYIHKDSKAIISSDGLIGNKIVVLTSGSLKYPFVEDGDRLSVDKTLSTDDIMKTLQKNNKNLIEITENFKIISNKLVKGEGTIGMLLSDNDMPQKIKLTMANLQTATANANKLSVELAQFSAKLNTKGGLADKMLTDTSVFNKLVKSASSIQNTARSAASMAENLNLASKKLTDANSPLGVMLNDPEAAQNLKTTIKNLSTSSKKLDEDLEALQHNFLLRGFFKKKAKGDLD
jgi:phospholipid/cholesterol/gamma-HCH transport system substrate-binding protein